jgi:hypothetical protein
MVCLPGTDAIPSIENGCGGGGLHLFDTSEHTTTCVLCAAGMHGVREFLNEGLRMRNFSHDRVMTLIGISFDHYAPLIVTPYMYNGDLHKYLTNASNVGAHSSVPSIHTFTDTHHPSSAHVLR